MGGRSASALVIVAALCCAHLAVAQSKPGQGRTTFGIVGGLNLAKFTGSDVTGVSTRTSFYAGVAATTPLGTSLFFQPQVLYSAQGAEESSAGATLTLALDYLQVPLFLGLHIPMQGSAIRPYVMAGPYVGFKLSCKLKASSGGVSGSVNCDDPSIGAAKMKSTDFGLTFGAGVELPLGTGMLSLAGRFSMGLTDIEEGYNGKNSVISIGAGYFFGR